MVETSVKESREAWQDTRRQFSRAAWRPEVREREKALGMLSSEEGGREEQTSKWDTMPCNAVLRQEDQAFKDHLSNLLRPRLRIKEREGQREGRCC